MIVYKLWMFLAVPPFFFFSLFGEKKRKKRACQNHPSYYLRGVAKPQVTSSPSPSCSIRSRTAAPGQPVITLTGIASLFNPTMSLKDPLSIVSALERSSIIPDVVPPSLVPTHSLSILYPGKEVGLGNEFTVEETVDEPSVKFEALDAFSSGERAESSSKGEEPSYTLVMLDPDAPYRDNPEFRSFRHWVVSTIPRYTIFFIEPCIIIQDYWSQTTPDFKPRSVENSSCHHALPSTRASACFWNTQIQ